MRAPRAIMVVLQLLCCYIYVQQSGALPATPNLQPEEMPLHVPSLEEVAQVLQSGLSSNFEFVKVSVVDCPDLSEKPFSLAAKGLGGSPTIVEVGSDDYLVPVAKREKVYNMKEIIKATGINPAMAIGAGAGPLPYIGMSSEMIANLNYKDGEIHSLTRIAKITEHGKGNNFVSSILPDDVHIFSFMANLYISEGLPGKVIKVDCRTRIGDNDFVTALRGSLIKGYPEQSVGLGGTFLITNSKVRQHVQPDISDIPLSNRKMVDDWLKFFDMNAPLVGVGTVVTSDPGLTLRLFHFHTFSDHNDAGHYHYDLDAQTVNYLGYFNVGTRAVRFDRPPQT